MPPLTLTKLHILSICAKFGKHMFTSHRNLIFVCLLHLIDCFECRNIFYCNELLKDSIYAGSHENTEFNIFVSGNKQNITEI